MTTPTKARILSRLTEGASDTLELMELTGVSLGGIRSTISRLRSVGYRIAATNTTRGNPRYELLSGPGSMGESFICPGCKNVIRLGHVTDHTDACQFGPKVLASLQGAHPDERRRW